MEGRTNVSPNNNPNYKPVHLCAYTVSRSLEQQSRNEIVRWVNIGVLEVKFYSK
jgi:hypothetical protein